MRIKRKIEATKRGKTLHNLVEMVGLGSGKSRFLSRLHLLIDRNKIENGKYKTLFATRVERSRPYKPSQLLQTLKL